MHRFHQLYFKVFKKRGPEGPPLGVSISTSVSAPPLGQGQSPSVLFAIDEVLVNGRETIVLIGSTPRIPAKNPCPEADHRDFQIRIGNIFVFHMFNNVEI